MTTSSDTIHMARAIQLAERGLYSTHPNPRVGCVIVRDGLVVGEGWHRQAGEPHAEVIALQAAGAEQVRGATVYVTLEPCSHYGRTPPCADALVRAQVARVVVAVQDANPAVSGQGIRRLQEAGIDTSVGVLEAQAAALNAGFLRVMAGGRPWVRLKIAASLDGRTAMASGESQWITGPEARSDVQRLRARSAAIITGAGTVRADDPSMAVRQEKLGDTGDLAVPVAQPLRMVLDGGLTLSPDAKIISGPGRCTVVATEQGADSSRNDALQQAGADVIRLPALPEQSGRVDLAAALAWLGREGYHEILIEAGPTLAGHAIEAGLVDELWLYQAATFLGSRARPLAQLGFDHMADQRRWQVADRRQVGDDQRLILRPVSGAENG